MDGPICAPRPLSPLLRAVCSNSLKGPDRRYWQKYYLHFSPLPPCPSSLVSWKVSGLNPAAWQDAIVDQICERMFVALGAGNVKEAFDCFDVDGDGNIEYEEFVNTLKALEIGLSDEQARLKQFLF